MPIEFLWCRYGGRSVFLRAVIQLADGTSHKELYPLVVRFCKPLSSGLPDLSTAKVSECFVFRSSCSLISASYADVPIELQNHRA